MPRLRRNDNCRRRRLAITSPNVSSTSAVPYKSTFRMFLGDAWDGDTPAGMNEAGNIAKLPGFSATSASTASREDTSTVVVVLLHNLHLKVSPLAALGVCFLLSWIGKRSRLFRDAHPAGNGLSDLSRADNDYD